MDEVILFNTKDLMQLFATGCVYGCFFSAFLFSIGYVVNFFGSLIEKP